MPRRPLLAAAAALLALGGAALASAQDMAAPPPAGKAAANASQPVPNPVDSRPDTHADTGYAGAAYGPRFLDIDGRIAALAPRVARRAKAAAALRAVKTEELVRRKRNGGELRDWDRELLNKRLDAVEAAAGPA